MNSAVNHNSYIIPVRIDDTIPSSSMEFYIGDTQWIDYISRSEEVINLLSNELKSLFLNTQSDDKQEETLEIDLKPYVLSGENMDKIGYIPSKRVTETIEIDYLTLKNSPSDYTINEDIEGTFDDWIEYAKNFPETCSGLFVGSKMVGYYQIELINENNFNIVLSGCDMVDASMQEFYGFGGEFFCYIVIMPILNEYENMANYLLLFDDFFNKIVSLKQEDVDVTGFAISVYSPLLESAVKKLGFEYVNENPAGGKIYQLMSENIRNSSILQKKYKDFFDLYEEECNNVE